MKIKRIYEQNEKPYYKELGYEMSLTDYLSTYYGLWLDSENLPSMSADDFDSGELTKEQNELINAFINLWNITNNFEFEYSKDDFIIKRNAKKYNL